MDGSHNICGIVIALVDAANDAQVAERLSITEPSHSRSVQALERRIGARLLDRGRRGVALTRVRRTRIQARPLIKQADAASREPKRLAGRAAGHVTIPAREAAASLQRAGLAAG